MFDWKDILQIVSERMLQSLNSVSEVHKFSVEC